MAAHEFDAATALVAQGDGVYTAVCDPRWNAPAGPNGGYVAALLARAVIAELDDPACALRALTVHYPRAPRTGEPLTIRVTVERRGRAVVNLALRAEQEGRLVLLGLAVASPDWTAALDYAAPAPVVPPVRDLPPRDLPPDVPPIARRYDMRIGLGPMPFSGGEESLTGGWIRFNEPRACDAPAAVAYMDAWLPAPFSRLTAPAAAPTLDFTVHLRRPLPLAGMAPEDHVMIRMSSGTSAHGFFEGDCELWSPDGVLLAHARQLALLIPMEGFRPRSDGVPA